MKTQLISYNAPELILFFAGWGMPPSAVQSLSIPAGCDLLICYDYQDLQLDFDFSHYQHIHLVAWSMGVWVASQTLPTTLAIKNAVAINGTERPCHDSLGIAEHIFLGTLHGLNESTLTKFQRRMCVDHDIFQQYRRFSDLRSATTLKTELGVLYQAIQQRPHQEFTWKKAIVGMQDRIFLPENQINYWQDRTVIQQEDLPHFPFFAIQSWDALWV